MALLLPLSSDLNHLKTYLMTERTKWYVDLTLYESHLRHSQEAKKKHDVIPVLPDV